MTCVMTGADREPGRLSAAEEQPPRELAERRRAGRLRLTGKGSLLGPMAKMMPEAGLPGEADGYLRQEAHQARAKHAEAATPRTWESA